MAELELRKVVKRFGAAQVIQGIDLAVRDGEFVVFVGPSGCGKSTLLRMIAGLEAISDGEVLIDGAVMNEVPAARRELAMVFQSYALYPHMNVRKNLSFGLETLGVSRAEIERKVRDAAEILQINELLDRRPGQLSGGQRQRVAIGRAIVREPRIFLFDEPLSNLDAELRMQMRVEINKLHRRLGATMIFVTHDQVEAMTLADRIVVLRKGVIEQVGTPLELYNRPANIFVAGFIGSPRMNLLPGRIGTVDGHQAELDLDYGRACAPTSRTRRSRARPSRSASARSTWFRSRPARASCRARCRSPSSSAARPTSTYAARRRERDRRDQGPGRRRGRRRHGARLRRRQVPCLRPRRSRDPARVSLDRPRHPAATVRDRRASACLRRHVRRLP